MAAAERLLTPEEVAERLGLSLLTVRDKLRAGALPGFHMGRGWRVREADLDAYVRELAEAGAAERAAKRKTRAEVEANLFRRIRQNNPDAPPPLPGESAPDYVRRLENDEGGTP